MAILERLFSLRMQRHWARVARQASAADLNLLRARRAQARGLKANIDRVIHVADSRLALPRIGSNAFTRPGGTLWSWRPTLWRGPLGTPGIAAAENRTALGDEVTLFHDCGLSELSLRQVRNVREEDLAPFGLRMDVFRFDGSYLSLSIACPIEAVTGLQKRQIVRLAAIIETEKSLEIFARLNVKHGPNTEQMVQELPSSEGEVVAEFDLAYSDLNEKRIEKMWIDLIFEGPEMNQVTIRDLNLCRYPRAEL